jgi:DNA-binding beta-propeller fold protein YncE
MKKPMNFAAILAVLTLSHTASAETLWVTGTDKVGAYDVQTGRELASFDIPGRTADLHVLPNGHVVLNYRAKGELVLFDTTSRKEMARLPSSRMGGVNPHHGYLLKTSGNLLYVVGNDGENAERDSTLSLFRVVSNAPGLEYAGEIRHGAGHHKIAHFPGEDWISVSNINDCGNVIQVVDIANPAAPKTIRSIGAKDIGYDGSGPDKTCDASGKAGRRLTPHGAGATGQFHVHNLNATGQMVVVRRDGRVFVLQSAGTGGASAVATRDGKLYMTQFSPRDGSGTSPGKACQIGQLSAISSAGTEFEQIPVLKDKDCTEKPSGARLGYVSMMPDGQTMLLPLATLGNDAVPVALLARFKVGANGVEQLSSLEIGKNLGHRDHAWSTDGKLFAFPNNKDNSVSIIGAAEGRVVRTIPVVPDPLRVALSTP